MQNYSKPREKIPSCNKMTLRCVWHRVWPVSGMLHPIADCFHKFCCHFWNHPSQNASLQLFWCMLRVQKRNDMAISLSLLLWNYDKLETILVVSFCAAAAGVKLYFGVDCLKFMHGSTATRWCYVVARAWTWMSLLYNFDSFFVRYLYLFIYLFSCTVSIYAFLSPTPADSHRAMTIMA